MDTRRIALCHSTWRKLRREASGSGDARYAMRCRIVLRLAAGVGVNKPPRQLACSPSNVTRTRDRWLDGGWAGLMDRREDNGTTLADEAYVDCVRRLLEGTPQDHGHRQPTSIKRLLSVYANKRTIHVMLDNYCIHTSRRTLAWVAEHGGKFRFHFPPTYSPDLSPPRSSSSSELREPTTPNE